MADLVTVVVPVYNVEEFLDECVQSVLAQTHMKLEVILVNDGSTDLSGEISDAWAARDTRVRVIHQRNGGLSAARNSGLTESEGDYITFVDSDDMVAPNFVEHLLGVMVADNSQIVVSQAVPFVGGAPSYRSPISPSQIVPAVDGLVRVIAHRANWSAWGKLYARDVFRDALRFRPGILYEDLEFAPRAFSCARWVSFTDAALYGYRQREGSIMAASSRATSPDLITVLASNVDHARATHGQDSVTTGRLVTAYVLHAARTLERMADGATRRRSQRFLRRYRSFVSQNCAAVRRHGEIGHAYILALKLSTWSPDLFAVMFDAARRLKSTIAPNLRRRSHSPDLSFGDPTPL